MKKILFAALLAASTFAMYAVPSGAYYYRDNLRAVVDHTGKTISVCDRQGNVTHTLTVIQENSDGSFTVKDQKYGIVHYSNGWWQENGQIHMNLQWLPNTVTRR